MKSENKTILKIEIEDKDIVNFKSAIKKVCDTENQIGFTKIGLTPDEVDTLKRLNGTL